MLVLKTLEECQAFAMDPSLDEPDKDFMIVALDLLSGIVQALNADAEPLVASTNPPVVQFLSICIQVHTIQCICKASQKKKKLNAHLIRMKLLRSVNLLMPY